MMRKKFRDFFAEANVPAPPPAIVQQVQAREQSFWTSDFLAYIMSVENGVRSGWDENSRLWFSHESVEGGTDTIAYGHKLRAGESYPKGLTEKQARVLLVNDLAKAYKKASSIIDQKFGRGTFQKLDNNRKEMAVDFAFNGVLHKFPKFMKGLVRNDKDIMRAEYMRYTDGKPLRDRNERFYDRYLR